MKLEVKAPDSAPGNKNADGAGSTITVKPEFHKSISKLRQTTFSKDKTFTLSAYNKEGFQTADISILHFFTEAKTVFILTRRRPHAAENS